MSVALAATPNTFRLAPEGTQSQVKFWSDVAPGEVAFIGPLGCGKTWALGIKALILQRANVGTDSILLVPTHAMAARVHKREWPALWSQFDHIVKVQEGDNPCFVWPWGDKTWIVSAEKPDRMKSINAGHAMMDEPGQIAREAFDVLCSRVRAPKAKARQVALGGTPEGINWFADLFGNPDGVHRRTIWATGWHKSQAHYPAQLKRIYGYDQALLDTYGKGRFVSLFGGGCYKHFSYPKHVTERCEYNRNLPLVLACDFNIDYMRWLVCQFTFDEIRVFDEIAPGRNCTTEQAAKEFVARYGEHRTEVTVTGDAAGEARKTSASQVDYQVIIEVLRAADLIITKNVSASNPRQRERVDSVNYHLAGRGRSVFINPRCKELILDLERNVWKEGTSEIDKSDMARTHAADAFGYAVYNLARPSVIVRQEVPAPIPVHHDAVVHGVW